MSLLSSTACMLLGAGLLSGAAFAGPGSLSDLAENSPAETTSARIPDTSNNPLLKEWTGPYGGLPPFDQVKVIHFKPALEKAMAENLAAVERIAKNPKPATFENTLAELERADKTLKRVRAVYGVWAGNLSSPEFQAVQREMEPKLAGLSDQIHQNTRLFKRIEKVYESAEKANLTPEQQRVAWHYYTTFVRAGARLDAEAQKRLSAINQQLAGLFTRFSQNLLADEMNELLVIEREGELAGLPQSVKDAAAGAAAGKNLKGKWVITNTRSSVDPFLTYADNRKLREKAWRMFVNRGDNGNETDNNALITEILQLRAERAKLLGYETHAHWRLENSMAKTPERALELLQTVWKPATARVKEEVADMQAVAKRMGQNHPIEPWDYKYYAEKVRKAKFDLDQNEVKQYLQLDKLREGMFWVAGELFNFSFVPAKDVPVFHSDVQVWEVKDKQTGQHVGLFYFDAFAREGKRSGAWATAYRGQQKMDGSITPLVSNNSNFVKGKPGEPTLISWDDATTLFHEFGHALHSLSYNITYPSMGGIMRDYVEVHSQLLEHWLATPEVLNKFALHYQTGKPIPEELVNRINKSATFNEGFETTEYLASALVDLKLHLAGAQKIDADKFERETLTAMGMPSELVMRHRTPQFGHVFSSDGYSAGYYSYLWADVLTADAFGAFTEAKGPYDKAVAQKLKQHIFSAGNTVDPATAYRSFRGRDPKTEALLRKRGFDKPQAEPKQEPFPGAN